MYRQLARETLGKLWAILSTARERPLTELDCKEAHRLAGLLENQPGVSSELHKALMGDLCKTILAFCDSPAPKSEARIDAVLDYIERARATLAE